VQARLGMGVGLDKPQEGRAAPPQLALLTECGAGRPLFECLFGINLLSSTGQLMLCSHCSESPAMAHCSHVSQPFT
jgi:hypothetical protein